MAKIKQTALARASRLIMARKSPDPSAALAVERDIAADLVPGKVLALDEESLGKCSGLYRHLSPYQATERFAELFYPWARWHAQELGLGDKGLTPGPLAFLGERTFSGLWQGTQLVNQLGLPQGFFIQHGMQYLRAKGRLRVATPGDLLQQATVEHVLNQWSDPALRYTCMTGLDSGWRDEVGPHAAIPEGILEVIDRHLEDGASLGVDSHETLSGLIGPVLDEDVARSRYGDSVVAEAIALRASHPTSSAAAFDQP